MLDPQSAPRMNLTALDRLSLSPRDDHELRYGLLTAAARGELTLSELQLMLRDLARWHDLDPSTRTSIRVAAAHFEPH